jgi:hypothetical protein
MGKHFFHVPITSLLKSKEYIPPFQLWFCLKLMGISPMFSKEKEPLNHYDCCCAKVIRKPKS